MISHEYRDPARCSLDPISLLGIGLGLFGGLASGMMSGGGGSAAAPAPAAPPTQPAPQAAPQAKPARPAQQPTFLGAAATPQPSAGGLGGSGSGKTLLGQ